MRKLGTKEKILLLVKVSPQNCIYWTDSNRQVSTSGIRSKASFFQCSPEACSGRDLNSLVLVVTSGVLWTQSEAVNKWSVLFSTPAKRLLRYKSGPLNIHATFPPLRLLPFILAHCHVLCTHTHKYICRKEGDFRICLVIPDTPVSAILVLQSCKKHVN